MRKRTFPPIRSRRLLITGLYVYLVRIPFWITYGNWGFDGFPQYQTRNLRYPPSLHPFHYSHYYYAFRLYMLSDPSHVPAPLRLGNRPLMTMGSGAGGLSFHCHGYSGSEWIAYSPLLCRWPYEIKFCYLLQRLVGMLSLHNFLILITNISVEEIRFVQSVAAVMHIAIYVALTELDVLADTPVQLSFILFTFIIHNPQCLQ
jgi:hypothetical protein